MPFWKREKSANSKVDWNKVDLIQILKVSVPEILRRDEVPCFGHAIDRIEDTLRDRLRPITKRAYKKGMLHLIPVTSEKTGEIKAMSFSELMEDGKFGVEKYAEPRAFFLFELKHSEEFQKSGPPTLQIFDRHKLWQELSMIEPVFKNEASQGLIASCRFMVGILYKGHYSSYRIMEFENESKALDFVSTTEKLLKERQSHFPTTTNVFNEQYKGQGFLVCEERMEKVIPKEMQSARYHYDIRWRYGNKVFSASATESKVDRTYGYCMLEVFVSNRKYLGILDESHVI